MSNPTPAELTAKLQQALADQYRFERELGGGGMSFVYLATELALGRRVVVKILSAERAGSMAIDRFTREIQTLATLQQANIVPLFAAGEVLELPYYTMPFVEGASLRHRLACGERFTPAEVVDIARDVARALSYAHAKGIIHRDIKPDNILQSHGTAVVTDFGIAKAVAAARREAPQPTLTQYGAAVGTPSYMAPEQALADPDIGPPADLYALGCVLYELLSGRRPFERDDPRQVLAGHLFDPPDAPIRQVVPDVPDGLARLIERCMEKDPAARPPSADDLLASLSAIVSEGNVAAPFGGSGDPAAAAVPMVTPEAPGADSLQARAVEPAHHGPVWRLAVAALLVLLAIGGYYAVRATALDRTAPRTATVIAQARALVVRRTTADLATAIRMLQEALARDSVSAPAWALLSEALTLQALYSNVPAVPTLDAASDASAHALRLDPKAGEALATQAYLVFLRDWRPLRADSAFRAVYAAQPDNALAEKWHSDVLDALGRHGEAWRGLETARRADSTAGAADANLARELVLSGDTTGAIDAFERALVLNPLHPLVLRDLSRLVFERGDSARFFALHDKHLLASDRSGAPTATLRLAWARGGRRAVAEAQVHAFERENLPFERAYWRAYAGDVGGALRDLDAAITARDPWIAFLGRFPSAELRRSAGFPTLLEKAGLPPIVH